MRHAFASLAVQSGANIKALQNVMGHKSASVGLDIYSHLFDGDLEALGDSLGSLIPERRGAGAVRPRGYCGPLGKMHETPGLRGFLPV
ncbi:tyrosine-type recombinase/integrase [Nesterenkonia populi]|uniref:tyrosine-type recombinase/integrase n=1 Tax=Nesterenkonia populi TaxID=1591087 RepID=UPI0011BDB74B|nr:tyrosine-type recombinase/integrase [Nesterenkonia populi]